MNSHYELNKDKYREAKARNTARYREEIRNLKAVPCADCGERYPYFVMDFDHVNSDKLENVATLLHRNNIVGARIEAEKCDVVCANCHRVRTHFRALAKTD